MPEKPGSGLAYWQRRVNKAAMLARLDGRDESMAILLASDDPLRKAAALVEAGWWAVLRRYPHVLDAVVADGDPHTRRALARAAAEHGHVSLLLRVVELLMAENEKTRMEAFTIFAQHRPDEIDGYDPAGDEVSRRKAYERVKRSIAK